MITITGDPKEIAALVVALQERREDSFGSYIQTGTIDSNILEAKSVENADGTMTCYGVPSK